MKFFAKIYRFIKRRIARIIFFFITDNFDEFIGNSAPFQNVQNLQRIISEEVNQDRFRIKEIENKLKLKHKLQNIPGIDYVKFENKFRGDEALIRERQSEFLPFFKLCRNVLDIGCGRGEFLELMREKGICATGIDIDDGMIKLCKGKGLNVVKADVLEYLDNLKENEIDGVFCSQVIEHFSFREIQFILHTLAKKLRKDAIVLLETINPRCLPALRRFYLDTTHVQPVDYEALAFLIENYGFRANAGVLSSPVDPSLDKSTRELSMIDQYGDYALIINKI